MIKIFRLNIPHIFYIIMRFKTRVTHVIFLYKIISLFILENMLNYSML